MVLGCTEFLLICGLEGWTITDIYEKLQGDGGGILIGAFVVSMFILDGIGFVKLVLLFWVSLTSISIGVIYCGPFVSMNLISSSTTVIFKS